MTATMLSSKMDADEVVLRDTWLRYSQGDIATENVYGNRKVELKWQLSQKTNIKVQSMIMLEFLARSSKFCDLSLYLNTFSEAARMTLKNTKALCQLFSGTI